MHAELAYLFRHAVLRDAAYELQLPGDRAQLHALAFHIMEQVCGDPPPLEPDPFDYRFEPHPTDPYAEEFAFHARQALLHDRGKGRLGEHERKRLREHGRLFLWRAARVAQHTFQHEKAIQLCEDFASDESEPRYRAVALWRSGYAAGMQGRPEYALERYRQAAQLLEQHGEDEGRVHLLDSTGSLQLSSGRIPEAERCFSECLQVAREKGFRGREGVALGRLALLEHHKGDNRKAAELYEEAIRVCHEVGDRRRETAWIGGLASVLHVFGRMDEAMQHFDDAIRLARELNDVRNLGSFLGNRAIIHVYAGETGPAQEGFRQALQVARDTGDRTNEGLWLGNLAVTYEAQERFQEAEREYRHAIDCARQAGDTPREGLWSGNLGNLLKKLGRLEEAAEAYERARAIAAQAKDRRRLGIWIGNIAALIEEQGRDAEAEQQYEEALAIARETDDVRLEGIWLGALALLHTKQNQHTRARDEWQQGFEKLTQARSTRDSDRVRKQLSELLQKQGHPPLDENGNYPEIEST